MPLFNGYLMPPSNAIIIKIAMGEYRKLAMENANTMINNRPVVIVPRLFTLNIRKSSSVDPYFLTYLFFLPLPRYVNNKRLIGV